MKSLLPTPARNNPSELAQQVLQFRSRLQSANEFTAQDLRDLADLLCRTVEALDSCESELRGRTERIYTHQVLLDRRLLGIETSRLVRLVSSIAGGPTRLYERISSLFRTRDGARAALSRDYRRWLIGAQRDIAFLEEQGRESFSWHAWPKVSILMDITREYSRWLAHALASVEAQSYENWEVCIASDGAWVSADPALNALQKRTGKLRSIETPPGSTRTQRLRRAAEAASGEYVLFLELTDLLERSALFLLCERLQSAPGALIYTDQDVIDDTGQHLLPVLKPDWSPRLAGACAYTGGAVMLPRELCTNGLAALPRAGAEGHMLLVWAADQYRIEHLDKILYHERAAPNWRDAPAILPRSAAGSGPVASLTSSLPDTAVDIVVCSRTPGLARRCVEAIRSTTPHAKVEITLIQHVSGADPSFEAVRARRRIRYDGAFNFSLMNNMGVAAGGAPVVVLMNDDVIAAEEGWLEKLVEPLQDAGVGVCGAVLRYPDGTIQHAGIVTGVGDGVGHVGRFAVSSDLWPWLTMTREVSAVTGACMALRREVWTELNGLDAAFPNNYNDVDVCLRAWARGYRILCVSGLGLIHEECRTRAGVTHLAEREQFYARWPGVFNRTDPFYSSSLTPTEKIALGFE